MISDLEQKKQDPLTYVRIGHYHHHISVRGEVIDESGKVGILHLHAFELGANLAATQLELFYNVRHLFESLQEGEGFD